MQPPHSHLAATHRGTKLPPIKCFLKPCSWCTAHLTRPEGSQVCRSCSAERTPRLAQRPYSQLDELPWSPRARQPREIILNA